MIGTMLGRTEIVEHGASVVGRVGGWSWHVGESIERGLLGSKAGAMHRPGAARTEPACLSWDDARYEGDYLRHLRLRGRAGNPARVHTFVARMVWLSR